MVTTKDRIGYIRRWEDSDGWHFKLIESKITSVRVGRNRTSVYSKDFRALDAEELEDNTKLMQDHSNLILVQEPFITNDELSEYLRKVVDYWNEHGAESLLGEKYGGA